MNRLERMREEMRDWEIGQVNRYLRGEHVHYKRGRYERQHVAACLTGAIERACGIHTKGISVGTIYLSAYKREVRRRKKYWDRVVAGESTDTRRGYGREREDAELRAIMKKVRKR